MKTLAEIQQEMKQAELIEFINLEGRIREKSPHLTDYQVANEAVRLGRKQIMQIIGGQYSDSDRYRLLKEYFSQKIGEEYLRLPINREYQPSFQNSKVLRRLHKEGFIKMSRSVDSFRYGLKNNGWKPYGVHQTYLVLSEQSRSRICVYDV